MKKSLFIFILIALVIFGIFPIGSEQLKVEVNKEIYQELQENQETRVIVNLRESDKKIKEEIIRDIGQENIKHIFNESIALEISEEQLKELKEKEEIDSIIRDKPVQIFLEDSIPLIQADKTWPIQLSDKNLTGQGETICIVDTGIDYTHTGLGGNGSSNNEQERKFQKITPSSITFPSRIYLGFLPDQMISIDDDVLLYISNCEFNLFNFSSNQTQIVSPHKNFCPTIAELSGDNIVYTSMNPEYKMLLLNKKTNTTTEIVEDLRNHSFTDRIEIDGNFIAYTSTLGEYKNDSLMVYDIQNKNRTIIDKVHIQGLSLDSDIISYSSYEGFLRKFVIYNITSKEKQTIDYFSGARLHDLKNDEILYSMWGGITNFHYVIYNFKTGVSERIYFNDSVQWDLPSQSSILRASL